MARMSAIAAFLDVDFRGVDVEIYRVSAVNGADGKALVFATDEETLEEALTSGAGGVLASARLKGSASAESDRVLWVREARTAFAQVYARWFDEREAGVDGSAVIEEGVVMGEECVIGPRVVIRSGTTLGRRVKVQAGAVLGSDGFGYARVEEGYIAFPQIGTLWIGDDVEIGANTTIDRGALGETRIGRGTKIDNLVHIAHNCVIGEDVIIAAQVGMAGSCVIEDGAMLGGQVGLGERVTIGRGVVLGGQGGVLPGKRIDGEGVVYWGTPAQPVREYLRGLAKMRKK